MMTTKTNSVNPKLYFSPYAWEKMFAYVSLAEGEITGMGIVDRMGNDFLVTDVLIVEQEAGEAHATMDEEGMNSLMEELIRNGREQDLAKLNLWWHSHGSLSSFFSQTDEETIEKWSFTNYLISLVVNKKREYSARLDLKQPVKVSIDLPVSVHYTFPADEWSLLKEEVAKKVKVPKKVVYVPGKQKHRYFSQYSKYWSERDEQRSKSKLVDDEGFLVYADTDECCSDMGCCGLRDLMG
jgi:hypothetical protein